MRSSGCLISVAFATLLAGCVQEIVVLGCDGHTPDGPDAAPPGEDGGAEADAGSDGGLADAGVADAGAADAGAADGEVDAGPPDSGDPCDRYCLEGLEPSASEINVREQVTFTPILRNPSRTGLSFTTEAGDVVARRRAGLPPAILGELGLSVRADAATGQVTFAVTEVPTWFATTTFSIRLRARGPEAADPEVWAEAEVTVRGNVVLSGLSDIYAVASDGRPARSVNFTAGRLVSGTSFVRVPRDLLLARDGTLVVFDNATGSRRLRRFELTGENRALPDFDSENEQGTSRIRGGSGRGLTQLPDGRIVLVDYDVSVAPKTRLLIWREDGSFDREVSPLDGQAHWVGAAASPSGEMVVVERGTGGRLIRVNPDDATVIGPVVTGLSTGWNVVRAADGAHYVGITGAVLRITPQGGREQVSMLPGGSADYWLYLTRFGGDGILATRDTSSDHANVAAIRGTQGVGWFRQTGAGNASFLPQGIAHLD